MDLNRFSDKDDVPWEENLEFQAPPPLSSQSSFKGQSGLRDEDILLSDDDDDVRDGGRRGSGVGMGSVSGSKAGGGGGRGPQRGQATHTQHLGRSRSEGDGLPYSFVPGGVVSGAGGMARGASKQLSSSGGSRDDDAEEWGVPEGSSAPPVRVYLSRGSSSGGSPSKRSHSHSLSQRGDTTAMEEEDEDWDDEFKYHTHDSEGNSASTHSPVALNLYDLFGDVPQNNQGEQGDSLLDFLDRCSSHGHKAHPSTDPPLAAFLREHQPRPPKLFSSLRIKSSSSSHRPSSTSSSSLPSKRAPLPLHPSMAATTPQRSKSPVQPPPNPAIPISAPAPPPTPPPETFQGLFTWIQEMATDVISQAKVLKAQQPPSPPPPPSPPKPPAPPLDKSPNSHSSSNSWRGVSNTTNNNTNSGSSGNSGGKKGAPPGGGRNGHGHGHGREGLFVQVGGDEDLRSPTAALAQLERVVCHVESLRESGVGRLECLSELLPLFEQLGTATRQDAPTPLAGSQRHGRHTSQGSVDWGSSSPPLLCCPSLVDGLCKLLHYVAKLDHTPALPSPPPRGTKPPSSPSLQEAETKCLALVCRCLCCAAEWLEHLSPSPLQTHPSSPPLVESCSSGDSGGVSFQHMVFAARTRLCLALVCALTHLLLGKEELWSPYVSEGLLESLLLALWKQCRMTLSQPPSAPPVLHPSSSSGSTGSSASNRSVKARPPLSTGSSNRTEDDLLDLQACVAADALLLVLGYSPLTFKYVRPTGQRTAHRRRHNHRHQGRRHSSNSNGHGQGNGMGRAEGEEDDGSDSDFSGFQSPVSEEEDEDEDEEGTTTGGGTRPSSTHSHNTPRTLDVQSNMVRVRGVLCCVLLEHEWSAGQLDVNLDAKDLYYGGDKFRFVDKSERMWPVPILFALIPHLPPRPSPIIKAKACVSLGLYFFNLEHGDAQACHSAIHLPPPLPSPPLPSPPPPSNPSSNPNPCPRVSRASSSASTNSSTSTNNLNTSTSTSKQVGPSNPACVSCVCGDAGVDNYGVDIMGAAESLTFEATFLLRRPSPPTPSSASSLHRASSSLTSVGGLGLLGGGGGRGLLEEDGDVLTFSPRFLPAGEEGARGGSRLFFSSLGYAALKAFGDVLMRVNKPQYGIEIYETCIIILDAHGHLDDCRQLRRDLALACARARDRERALKHSYAILSDAKSRQCSSEVAFLTDLLASLHLDNGDLTLAHNVLAHTIAFLEAPNEGNHGSAPRSRLPPAINIKGPSSLSLNGLNAGGTDVVSRLCAERLYLRVAHVLMAAGDYAQAHATLHRLLCLLNHGSGGGGGGATAGKRVVVLAWLAKLACKQRDFSGCMDKLDQIVETRAKAVLPSRADRRQGLGTGGGGPPRTQHAAQPMNHATIAGVGAGLWQWSQSGGLSCSLESCLPAYSASDFNEDLGELTARNLYHARHYARALQAVTPTLCSVESAVGGLGGPSDGLMELGRLYYLRAKIQHKAALAPTDHEPGGVTLPFQVSCVPMRLQDICHAASSLPAYHGPPNAHANANGPPSSSPRSSSDDDGPGHNGHNNGHNNGGHTHPQPLSAPELPLHKGGPGPTGSTGTTTTGSTANGPVMASQRPGAVGGSRSRARSMRTMPSATSANNPANAPPTQAQAQAQGAQGGGSTHTQNQSGGGGAGAGGNSRWSSHRHSRKYTCKEDLYWDAARWYRRSWECYKAAGDVLHAAKAANALARLHLHPIFVPVALFKVPYDPSVLSLGGNGGISLLPRVDSTGSMRGGPSSSPSPSPTKRAASATELNANGNVTEKDKDKDKEREKAQRPTRPTRPGQGSGPTGGGNGAGGGGGKKDAPWKCLTIDTATVEAARAAMLRRRHSEMSEQAGSARGAGPSVTSTSTNGPNGLTRPLNMHKASPTHGGGGASSPMNGMHIRRGASLEDAEPAARYGLEVGVESCVPSVLLEAYLNNAELRLLQGDAFEAIAYWWEARDLFLMLYVDGAAVPLARVAPIGTVCKALDIARRLVRFLATCERPLLNQNLLLLDVLTTLQYDVDRLLVRARAPPSPSPPPPSSSSAAALSSPGAGGLNVHYDGPGCLPPLFLFPQTRRRRDSSLRRAAQKQRGPFKLMDTSGSSMGLLNTGAQGSSGRLEESGGAGGGGAGGGGWGRRRSDGEYSWWTRSLKRAALLGAGGGGGGGGGQGDGGGEGAGKGDASPLPLARSSKTKTLPSRLSSGSSSASLQGMGEGDGRDGPTGGGGREREGSSLRPSASGRDLREEVLQLVTPPMSKRTMAMAQRLATVATATAHSEALMKEGEGRERGHEARPSHYIGLHSHGSSGLGHRPMGTQGSGVRKGGVFDDGVLVRRLWCTMFLVRRQCGSYSLAQCSMAQLRHANRATLRQLVLQMKGLRARTGQAPAADFTYDELLSKAEATADKAQAALSEAQGQQGGGANGPSTNGPLAASAMGGGVMVERLRRSVMLLQLEDVLLAYSPHTGLRHLQRLDGGHSAQPLEGGGGGHRGIAGSGGAGSSVATPLNGSRATVEGEEGMGMMGSLGSMGGGRVEGLVSGSLRSLLEDMSAEGGRERGLGGGVGRRAETLAAFLNRPMGHATNGRAPSLSGTEQPPSPGNSSLQGGGGGGGGGGGPGSAGHPRCASLHDFFARVQLALQTPSSSSSSSSTAGGVGLCSSNSTSHTLSTSTPASAGAHPDHSKRGTRPPMPTVPPPPIPPHRSPHASPPKKVALSSSVPTRLLSFFRPTTPDPASSRLSPTAVPFPTPMPAHSEQTCHSPSSSKAPVAPLVLVCSKYLHYLPWEAAMEGPSDAAGQGGQGGLLACRYLCLHSLVNTPLEHLAAKAGPGALPQLFGFAFKGKGKGKGQREGELLRHRQGQLSSVALQRALWELRQPLDVPDSGYSLSLSSSALDDSRNHAPSCKQLLRRLPRLCGEDPVSDLWPLTCPVAPVTSSVSSLRLKLGRRRHITFFDASAAGANPFATLAWLESGGKHGGAHGEASSSGTGAHKRQQLPVFLLAYADLARLSDALLGLLNQRPDVVALFVPPCVAELLVREVSARRDAALAAGKKGLYAIRRRSSGGLASALSSRVASRGGENVPFGQHQPQPATQNVKAAPNKGSVVKAAARGEPEHGATPLEILAQAVQAIRVKHQLPVVAFNL